MKTIESLSKQESELYDSESLGRGFRARLHVWARSEADARGVDVVVTDDRGTVLFVADPE